MTQSRHRWLVAIVTLAALLLFVRLGWWQWQKSIQVQSQYDQYQARILQPPVVLGEGIRSASELEDLPVLVRGEYEGDQQFFLDNKQEQGVPGLHVITPLHIQGTNIRILVNRGWVAWGSSRTQLPNVPVPKGLIEVEGIVNVPSQKKFFGISNQELGSTERLRMRLDLQSYAAEHQYPIQPFLILQKNDKNQDGLVRHWEAPENRANMHRSYALQWMLISIALIIFVIYMGYKRNEK